MRTRRLRDRRPHRLRQDRAGAGPGGRLAGRDPGRRLAAGVPRHGRRDGEARRRGAGRRPAPPARPRRSGRAVQRRGLGHRGPAAWCRRSPRRGSLPLVVGGTGLYVSALLDGYVFARRRSPSCVHASRRAGRPGSARSPIGCEPSTHAAAASTCATRGGPARHRAGRPQDEMGQAIGATPYGGPVLLGLSRPTEVLNRRIDERAAPVLRERAARGGARALLDAGHDQADRPDDQPRLRGGARTWRGSGRWTRRSRSPRGGPASTPSGSGPGSVAMRGSCGWTPGSRRPTIRAGRDRRRGCSRGWYPSSRLRRSGSPGRSCDARPRDRGPPGSA